MATPFADARMAVIRFIDDLVFNGRYTFDAPPLVEDKKLNV
jgi:hypothetical protein